MERFFPTLGIVINLAAVVFYVIAGKWAWSLYWILAAGLTFTATYLMDKK